MKHFILLLAMLPFVLCSCSDDEQGEHSGEWMGTTSQGLPMSISVETKDGEELVIGYELQIRFLAGSNVNLLPLEARSSYGIGSVRSDSIDLSIQSGEPYFIRGHFKENGKLRGHFNAFTGVLRNNVPVDTAGTFTLERN